MLLIECQGALDIIFPSVTGGVEGICWFSVEPGEIGLTALEEAGDGIHQYAKDRLAQLTAGLAQRKRPFDPAIALVTLGATGALAPYYGKAQGSLSAVVGWFHAMLTQEDPQRGHLALQASGQAPGIIGPLMVALDQGAQPGLPGAPLAPGRWRFGHVA